MAAKCTTLRPCSERGESVMGTSISSDSGGTGAFPFSDLAPILETKVDVTAQPLNKNTTSNIPPTR